MDREHVARWVADYERLWRTAGTGGVGELFTEEATYLVSPWADPIIGLPALEAFWDEGRDGPQEQFEMDSSIVAVDGPCAVVRVSVEYSRDPPEPWRDLWVLTFAEDGRCSAFEEWPFAPRQHDGH